jgi:hypothetical protein
MTELHCIITGCALLSDGQWVAGDLFDAGEFYVFNGNVNSRTMGPDWFPMPPYYEKTLSPDDWFERRSVFVIHKTKANLNQAAFDYITKPTRPL